MEDAPRKRRLVGEINVVPLIDVMLVLLVIFMATAPLLTQGVQVELPRASASPLSQTQRSPPLIVSIDREGRRYLNTSRDPEQALGDAELRAQVAAALAAEPGRQVLLKGDRHAAYEHVFAAMVLLQGAGATQLGFLADPLGGGPAQP
jgi:biopolymer transport protein TolR